MKTAELADIAVPIIVALVGLWVANSLKLRRRAEREIEAIRQRFATYDQFWTATRLAAPLRDSQQALTSQDRADLHKTLGEWWFERKGGMLLGSPTRELYLMAKNNLICPVEELKPASAAEFVGRDPEKDQARSQLAIRQLSLVRNSMRADLGIVTRPYGKTLEKVDRDFLRLGGVRLWERPWWTGSWRQWLLERFRAITQRWLAGPYRYTT
jgi:hypothetical protein